MLQLAEQSSSNSADHIPLNLPLANKAIYQQIILEKAKRNELDQINKENNSE